MYSYPTVEAAQAWLEKSILPDKEYTMQYLIDKGKKNGHSEQDVRSAVWWLVDDYKLTFTKEWTIRTWKPEDGYRAIDM